MADDAKPAGTDGRTQTEGSGGETAEKELIKTLKADKDRQAAELQKEQKEKAAKDAELAKEKAEKDALNAQLSERAKEDKEELAALIKEIPEDKQSLIKALPDNMSDKDKLKYIKANKSVLFTTAQKAFGVETKGTKTETPDFKLPSLSSLSAGGAKAIQEAKEQLRKQFDG